MEEVLARGPWMFGGKTILLQQWQPGFKFDRNKIKSIPVWARLQGLPFPLWNKQGLSMAASMVGCPLASDEATLNDTRVEYARVCIEIEADVPLVHHFQVASSLSEEPITVDVTYEWKPSRCETCKVFGHSCRTQAKEKERDIETLVTEDQKSEVKGKENGSHHANPTVVSKEFHQQKPNNEEGPRVNTMKENNEKVQPTSEGLTVGSKTGEHASTEAIPNQNKGNKAAAIVISPRDDLQGEPLICTMNKMVSVSSETKGKGKEIACEITGSSSEGQGGHSSQLEINSPSPKQKKKKKGGKKRQGGHSPRQVSHNKIGEVQDSILPLNWAAINNVEGNSNCRIFVGWNTRRVHVQCIHASDQWITCDIHKISSAHVTRITFVYGSNNYGDRISLWQYLETESLNNASIPWSILGDFNAVLRPNDRSGEDFLLFGGSKAAAVQFSAMNPKKQNKPHPKTPAAKETSWADRVKVTDASTRFMLDPIPPLAMGAKLEITEDMLTEHAEQWTRSMWHPHFVFDKNKIAKLPVWVRVFGLPFPLWSRKGLSLVASMIGKPLSCDEATFTCSRLDFARICVEIDASQPFIHNFDITTPLSPEPLHIEVEYEWKPVRCSQCHLFGHSCKPVDVAALKNGDIATVLPVEGACEGDGTEVDLRSKEKISKGKDTTQVSSSATAPGPVPAAQRIEPVGVIQKMGKPGSTDKVGIEESNGGTMPKQHKDKGKGIMVVVHEPQMVHVEREESISKAVGRTKGDELPICTVNTIASLQSQTSSDGDNSSGDSLMKSSSYDNRDTSPEAFTKVKKKKGGKKKGSEACGL
ncbi:hypothetical protein OIU84_020277 [Salix udensis]|uniref:DUF4283 domain-containing protein n=1 Tax=Salix udensis TaxID=889485 RepID=A0AAD6J6I9_9ROSI|nr:hypothetical protein OIU84_020277 [Salix udensis]